jgi:hypothetical protein
VTTPLRLHPDSVRELAVAIADELRGELPVPARPLTAGEVAQRLGRSPDYVRAHRRELGVLPAEGSRPRLLFDPQRVAEAMRAPQPPSTAEPERKTHPRSRTRSGSASLLPIRGTERAHG